MTIKEINPMKQHNQLSPAISLIVLITLLVLSTASYAGPGHDHGEETPVTTGESSPRVVMESELFEAVGIVNGRTLQIYIDNAQTNTPIEDATVELELNGQSVPVKTHSEGEFDAELPEAFEEDSVSVAMTISAGENTDLLAGELILDQHEELDSGTAQSSSYQRMTLLYALGGLFLLGMIVLGYSRLKHKGGK
jgi:hypothetical protein